MREQTERLFEAVTSSERAKRMDALGALSLLRAGDKVRGEYVLAVAERLLNHYPLRDAVERGATARFLETWFLDERDRRLSLRLGAARMEETDEKLRESLLSAVVSVTPNRQLVALFADPPEEHCLEGLGLLMLLEAIAYRVRARAFSAQELPALLAALRRARALRASHIARPFLWRLEDVIASVLEVSSRYQVDGRE